MKITEEAAKLLVREHVENFEEAHKLWQVVEHYKKEYDNAATVADDISALYAVYQGMNEETEKFLQKPDVKASCKKGCAFCCHINIEITEVELKLIAAWIEENNIKVDMSLLKKQLSLDHHERPLSPHSRCVFLSPENTCNIYEVRPFACRKYFVQSKPKFCDAKRKRHEVKIVSDPLLEAATIGVYIGKVIGNMNVLLHEHLTKT